MIISGERDLMVEVLVFQKDLQWKYSGGCIGWDSITQYLR